MNLLLIQKCALPFDGRKQFPAYRLVNDAHDKLSCFFEAYRNREAWILVSKICGAVEGIEGPAEGRGAFRPASLFGNNGVVWEMRAQPRDDGLLGPPVRLRHDVDFPLVADVYGTAKFRQQNASSFPRRLDGHFKK